MKITKSQLKQIIKEELAEATNPVQVEALGEGPNMDKVQKMVYDVIEHLESGSVKYAIEDGNLERISAEINRVLGIMKVLEKEVGAWIHPNFRE